MKTTEGGEQILLWGAGSKTRLVAALLMHQRPHAVISIFDPTLSQPTYNLTARFANDYETLAAWWPELTRFSVCIGNNHGRARTLLSTALAAQGLAPISIHHDTSWVDPNAHIGVGCHLMPRALIHAFSSVGNWSIVNTAAVIDHECEVGTGVHVMGGAALAGRVKVGNWASIGTNATVLPDITIGEGAFVGAGAVVTRDVPAWSVVAGNPARHRGEALQAEPTEQAFNLQAALARL